eukprot:m.49352 g.49352  ORF g.49352 m.49352 type:complete len:216 (-) comp6110_c0_seq2:267-914(-)
MIASRRLSSQIVPSLQPSWPTCLQRCRALQSRLDCNPLRDDGARHLAAWLTASPPLQQIDLSDCGISDAGARHLVDAVRVNTTLRSITGLGEESALTDEMQDALLAALRDPGRAARTGRDVARADLENDSCHRPAPGRECKHVAAIRAVLIETQRERDLLAEKLGLLQLESAAERSRLEVEIHQLKRTLAAGRSTDVGDPQAEREHCAVPLASCQ